MSEQVEWDMDANVPVYTRDYLKHLIGIKIKEHLYDPRECIFVFQWQEEQYEGANPDTCQHRIITRIGDREEIPLGLCLSCDSTLDPEWIRQNHWEYDHKYKNWVWTGRCDC